MPALTGGRTAATAAGLSWRLEHHATLPSTSDLCIARAAAGEPAGLAIRADTQTAGRGSRGRRWLAPPGNLNLSALIRPSLPMAQSGLYALLAGLTAAEAMACFLPPAATPMLKWPNDVLIGGAKLAGILIDSAAGAARLDWLVFGIGINLTHAPAIPGRATTTLAAHGGGATPETAAALVLERLGHWLDVLEAGGGETLRAAWLARAHPPGTPIELVSQGEALRGGFAGLSPSGELLLDRNGAVTRISTGEILLGSRAAPCCS